MADDDKRDDKLIAVPLDPELRNGFSRLHDLHGLDTHYAAIREILYLWFSSYWGVGATRVIGWGNAAEAAAILEAAKINERSASPAAADLRPRGRRPFVERAR